MSLSKNFGRDGYCIKRRVFEVIKETKKRFYFYGLYETENHIDKNLLNVATYVTIYPSSSTIEIIYDKNLSDDDALFLLKKARNNYLEKEIAKIEFLKEEVIVLSEIELKDVETQ